MNNLERTRQVQYQLYTNRFGSINIDPPEGWQNDTRSYTRDKDSKAILSKTEISLEFYGNASDFLLNIFRSFGIQEKVLLSRFEKSTTSVNENWKLRYVQQLNLGSLKHDSATGKVTCKATEGGLYEDVNNRKSDEFDILTNESADGVDIGELVTHQFQPVSRGIFAESYLKDVRSNYAVATRTLAASDSEVVRTIPLELIYESDDDVQGPALSQKTYDNPDIIGNHTPTSKSPGDQQSEGDNFFEQADLDKRLRVRMKLVFNISDHYSRKSFFEDFEVCFRVGEIDLATGDQVLKSHETLLSTTGVGTFDPKQRREELIYEFDRELDIAKNESLSFCFYLKHHNSGGAGTGNTAKAVTYINVKESWVRIEDKTDYPVYSSKCLKPFTLFERIIAKITGKTGIFRSSIFGEGGEYEHFVVDNGFWARGFPDVIIKEEDGEEVEERIQFKTSFKDAFESFCYLEPLCWFVETEGNKQVLRVEKATYTMQNFIGVDLGHVDEIEHEASEPDFFSSVTLGHEGSLEYEELNGLDEPNGKSEFSTHITTNDSKYTVLSKYRVDSVGYELIRRKAYLNFPKEDTSRDSDIWIHDAKLIHMTVMILGVPATVPIDTYTHNLWTDLEQYTSAPKGIFDPDSAWNLRLSPMNRLVYGHGYSIKRGLYHYPDNYIRFSSSNANSNLKTYVDLDGEGEIELAENGKIRLSLLEKPRIEAEKTSVSFRMTQPLEDRFTGTTTINGRPVPNFFGLIRFIERGNERFGRIEKLSGEEKIKLVMMNAKL